SWTSADAVTMQAVGAFPLTPGSKDAVLVVTLGPGNYTAQVSGAGGTSGVALLEVYDVSGPARLLNLSTRALVASGNASLIAGLVVAPGDGARHLLIRAAGPALSVFGPGANQDPSFAVLNAQNQTIAMNDNWGTANVGGQLSAAFTQAGAFPFPAGSKDAALVG